MKKLSLIIIIAICGLGMAVNYNSPIGNPTVPPSSTRSGLVRSPSPIDLNGNLIVTGNVADGKEFRGVVPYRSETELGTSTASDSFNSFMRRTASTSTGTKTSYLPQPYYMPSRTTSSLNRGVSSGLVTYSSVKQTGGTGDFAVPKYANAQAATGVQVISLPYEYTLSRPLSYTNPVEINKLVTYGLLSQKERRDVVNTLNKEGERTSGIDINKKLLPQDKDKNSEDTSILQPIKPAERTERDEVGKSIYNTEKYAKRVEPDSIYEQMLKVTGQIPAKQEQTQPVKESNEPEDEAAQKDSGRSKLSVIDAETAAAMKGIYKTFATEANTKFNYYMKSAEEFLKQGKYYRAADAYTLASIYNPDDPLAYAGRAHALFASGEYMSSAYYLMRAINMFPQYVEVRVDLNAMIPDKDKLDGRIANVTQWIEKTKSPELQFLLAYVYYQLDKTEQATNAIDASAAELPDNPAVNTLKKAIKK